MKALNLNESLEFECSSWENELSLSPLTSLEETPGNNTPSISTEHPLFSPSQLHAALEAIQCEPSENSSQNKRKRHQKKQSKTNRQRKCQKVAQEATMGSYVVCDNILQKHVYPSTPLVIQDVDVAKDLLYASTGYVGVPRKQAFTLYPLYKVVSSSFGLKLFKWDGRCAFYYKQIFSLLISCEI